MEETRKDAIGSFIEAWIHYAEYVKLLPGMSADELQVCEDVLFVLKSDNLIKLINEVLQGRASQSTLDKLEECDVKLLKLKIIDLHLDKEHKDMEELSGRVCITIQRFILEMCLRAQGRFNSNREQANTLVRH